MIKSLTCPEKLPDKGYGVLCVIIGKHGCYRKMIKFSTKKDANNFFASIPEGSLL